MNTVKKFAKLYVSLIILGVIVYRIEHTTIALALRQLALAAILLYTGYVIMETLDYLMDKIKEIIASN